MYRSKDDCRYEVIKNMKGGDGEFRLQHILNKDEFFGKGRLFAKGVLPPHSSVGMHEHISDMEVCYFLSGKGLLREENLEKEVKAGDVNIVFGGKKHEIINNSEEDLVYMVLVLFTE